MDAVRFFLEQHARKRRRRRRVVRRVLLHEMAHCSVWIAGVRDDGEHGPRFVAELKRLAARGEAWALDQATRYIARGECKRGPAIHDTTRSAPGLPL